MKALAKASSGAKIFEMLEPLIKRYVAWIDMLAAEAEEPDIQGTPKFHNAAKLNIERCREAAVRMRAGLELLPADQVVDSQPGSGDLEVLGHHVRPRLQLGGGALEPDEALAQ